MNKLLLRETGMCRRCLSRNDGLPDLGATVHFVGPLALPCPGAASAATRCLDVVARSKDHELEVELYDEGRRITLEVRTRHAGLRYQLVAYRLRGGPREAMREGFLVLRPELDGWFVAETSFDARELHSELNGQCEDILVRPVCIHVLTNEQRELLLDSAARVHQDTAARAAWRAWLRKTVERSESVTDEGWQLLCDIRRVLMRE